LNIISDNRDSLSQFPNVLEATAFKAMANKLCKSSCPQGLQQTSTAELAYLLKRYISLTISRWNCCM